MTLSILIPTYNYHARALVRALQELVMKEGVEAEIVVGDDASTEETAWMEEAATWEGVRVVHYAENAGRAAHRNRMAETALGEWLLFIDCDAAVEADFSLRAYLEATTKAPVVCGGVRTPAINPNPEATLRYAYERAADRHRSAGERNRKPYFHLTTFNLFVRRDVFLNIRFDETCQDYGYEDALFGVELAKRDIPILHIDNPLIHMGIESNSIYLKKTETALQTLKRLQGKMQGHSHVENTANRLKQYHLTWLVRLFYCTFYKPIRHNLLGSRPNLTLFSFYKLGYFLNLSPHS